MMSILWGLQSLQIPGPAEFLVLPNYWRKFSNFAGKRAPALRTRNILEAIEASYLNFFLARSSTTELARTWTENCRVLRRVHICFVSDSHWLGLRELVSWADHNPCLADILIFGAAGTVLNSSSLRHFFWDSSGLLTMFLGSGWLDFSCQFRGVAMASPGLGVSWFRLGSAWFWHPDALSNFHSAHEQ